jgi:putative transposase
MPFNPDIHHRKSIRLKGYDYSQAGLYFLTICVKNTECLFGNITDGKMRLNPIGEIAQAEWLKTAEIRANIRLHESVIMPNHMHSIIEIISVGADCLRPIDNHDLQSIDEMGSRSMVQSEEGRMQSAPTLGDIVKGYKSAVTRRINELRDTPGGVVWLRNYYEHIIRDESAYLYIAEYVQTNPQRWQQDKFHIP